MTGYMKKLILGVMTMGMLLSACRESEQAVNSDLTGNQTVYSLQAGSTYNISGTVTFKEKKDGTALIDLALTGTEGTAEFPVHLHMGNIAAPDAAVAALLNPVQGKSGASETNLLQLADESKVTYAQLLQLSACVKVHLGATGPDRDIILAAGNIGQAASTDVSSGRLGISVCKSE